MPWTFASIFKTATFIQLNKKHHPRLPIWMTLYLHVIAPCGRQFVVCSKSNACVCRIDEHLKQSLNEELQHTVMHRRRIDVANSLIASLFLLHGDFVDEITRRLACEQCSF